jgi:hypothetical protein
MAAVIFFALSVVVQRVLSKGKNPSLLDWWTAGGHQFGSAGVIVTFFLAFVLLMWSTELAYGLKGPAGAWWDFLSFTAPSTSAIVVVFAVARQRRWWFARIFRRSGFAAQIIAISGIPIGYVGYVVSHYFPGLGIWMLKTSLVLIWMPVGLRIVIRKRLSLADGLYTVAWAFGLFAIFVAITAL